MIRSAVLAAAFLLIVLPVSAAPRVVSSIMPVNALVAAVMDGIAVPQTLLPPGASPHSHALRPSDARMLAEADVIFWIGPELETFLEGPLDSLARNARKVALVRSRGILLFDVRTIQAFDARPGRDGHDHDDHGTRDHDDHDEEKGGHGDHADDHGHADDNDHTDHDSHGHDHAPGSIDGHIWLDPANAQVMIRAIAAVMSEVDPVNAGRYQENAEAATDFTAETWALVDEKLEPVRSLRFVTYHDAFQYFEAAFALRSAGIVALNPDAPPGARAIKRLRDRIRAEGVTCAFFEPQYDGRAVHALTRDMGLGFSVLDPMGPVGPPGAGQYRSMLLDMADGFRLCAEGG